MSSDPLAPRNHASDVPPVPAEAPAAGADATESNDIVATRDAPGTAVDRGATEVPPGAGSPASAEDDDDRRVTRTGMVWAATIAALVALVLLIIFIAQNQASVQLRYFQLEGTVNLGLALLVAAVAGGFLVASAGAARIIQLRTQAHRRRARNKR
ncbi:MAG: lipopolysaccharide assembly protein LapA domain-containing protein [Arthrobacter sp.]|uniref:LapA family protein n=1 Tax=Arthrobacter sp. TaxID=1667 RepID=UPI0034743941